MPTTTIESLKLLYLIQELGEMAVVPNGAIVNIGGVSGPTFTVGGKPLLFADGTSTDGSASNFLKPDFQNVYVNSTGEAFISFAAGKDLVLQAVNHKQFRFDADTGDVTISGNLIVQGSTTTVINASVDTDRIAIHQTSGTYVPFIMEPLGGVTPTVNVVDIKVARSGASVFTIGPTGQTYIKDLQVGLINGLDFTALARSITDHITHSATIKHAADEISVNTHELGAVSGTNVQQAIDSIATAVNSLIQRDASDISGLEWVQGIPSRLWIINHNRSTKNIQLTIWDENNEQILPDVVKIDNNQTVSISFGSPIKGRVIMMLFGPNASF